MKVVVRFSDGLGNQLFQFALGRYIADILDCDIFSDETHFIVSENRTFQMCNLLQPNSLRRWGRFREFAFFLLWMIKYKFGEKFFRIILKFIGITWIPVRDSFKLQSDFDEDKVRSLRGG